MTPSRRSFLAAPLPFMAGAVLADPDRVLHASTVEPDDPKLTIKATTARVEYRQLEPFEVTVTIENKTDRSMYFPFEGNKYMLIDLAIHILNQGRWIATTQTQYFKRVSEFGSPGKSNVSIASGEKRVYALIPNLVADMTISGKYSIAAAVTYCSDRVVNSEKKTARSEPIVLIVAGGEPFVSRRI